MKKTKRKVPRKGKAAAQPQTTDKALSRRSFLARGALYGGAAVMLAGAGWFSVTSVQVTMAEHDLTRIGNGRPAIVQIHDPGCALCRSLMKETRAALRELPAGAVQYLVANIDTAEGSALAATHGVPHVTLLLFDGDGKLQQTIRGTQDRDALVGPFQRLAPPRS